MVLHDKRLLDSSQRIPTLGTPLLDLSLGPSGPHLQGDKERPEVTQGVTRLLLENLMSKPFSFIGS